MPLTDKQARFAKLIADGVPQSEAARAAGYANSSPNALAVTAARLIRHPEVQRAAFEYREARLTGPLAQTALATLEEVMKDVMAAPGARVQAARFVLEASGHGIENRRLDARYPRDLEKPLSELSIAELEAMVRRSEESLASLRDAALPILEAEAERLDDD